MIDEKKLIEFMDVGTFRSPDEICFSENDVVRLIKNFTELSNELGLNEQPKTDWIPCEVEMPKEHDSMFAKFKGTDKWSSGMFEKTSDEVNVTIELQDGSRITRTTNTIDGKWEVEINPWLKQKVVAWQPLPQPYKKEGAE